MSILTKTIETKWNNFNRDWFIERGYDYTGYRDKLIVKVEDLMPSSGIEVEVECSHCHEVYSMCYGDVRENIDRNNGEFICYKCKASESKKFIKNTHPEIYNLLANKEDGEKYSLYDKKIKLDFQCKTCNSIYKANPYKLSQAKTNLCPFCGDGFSFNNKFVFNVLKPLCPNLKREYYNKDWCYIDFKGEKRKVIYDFEFSINDQKFIIEADGGFHFKTTSFSKETLEDVQVIDKLKEQKAIENGYNVIRIDCYEKSGDYVHIDKEIKKQLINKLGNLIDFSKVDWNKCCEISKSSEIKNVWELYNSGLSKKEIMQELQLSKSFVNKSFRTGRELGLVDYETFNEKSDRNTELIKELWLNGVFDYEEIMRRTDLNNKVSIYNKLEQLYEETKDEIFNIDKTRYCYCYEDNCFYNLKYLASCLDKEYTSLYRGIFSSIKRNGTYYEKHYKICNKQESYFNSRKYNIELKEEVK